MWYNLKTLHWENERGYKLISQDAQEILQDWECILYLFSYLTALKNIDSNDLICSCKFILWFLFYRYGFMTVKDILELPIDKVLKEGALVVTWCTNNQSHIQEFLAGLHHWDLQLLATWYWLKVRKYLHSHIKGLQSTISSKVAISYFTWRKKEIGRITFNQIRKRN